MEDKWFVFVENSTIHLHRSATGYCLYQVELEETGSTVTANRARVTNKKSIYHHSRELEHEGRMIEFIVRGLVLGQDVECPASIEQVEYLRGIAMEENAEKAGAELRPAGKRRGWIRRCVGRWLDV